MVQLGVAAIGLPFRRGTDDHGNRLALAVLPESLSHLEMFPFLIAMLARITRKWEIGRIGLPALPPAAPIQARDAAMTTSGAARSAISAGSTGTIHRSFSGA